MIIDGIQGVPEGTYGIIYGLKGVPEEWLGSLMDYWEYLREVWNHLWLTEST